MFGYNDASDDGDLSHTGGDALSGALLHDWRHWAGKRPVAIFCGSQDFGRDYESELVVEHLALRHGQVALHYFRLLLAIFITI